MTRDILSELRNGAITSDEADTVANDILASPDAADIVERLQLSKKEYTAYMSGTPFKIIAGWRYDGWPSECARCHRPLDSDRYGWRPCEKTPGDYVLEHLQCD